MATKPNQPHRMVVMVGITKGARSAHGSGFTPDAQDKNFGRSARISEGSLPEAATSPFGVFVALSFLKWKAGPCLSLRPAS